jgi:hypothetical protein
VTSLALAVEDLSLAHLLGRLAAVEVAVRVAVATRRATDPTPDDPFRGLYLADHDIDRLLEGPAPAVPVVPEIAAHVDAVDGQARQHAARGHEIRLLELAQRFDLDDVDVHLLLVALAPDLDSRFERFYGYLQDDVTRRRASVGLALELGQLPPTSVAARERLSSHGRLVASGLLVVQDLDRPTLTRSLLVPDRVASHLVGSDRPDHDIVTLLVDPHPTMDETAAAIAAAISRGATFVYLREPGGGSARSAGAAALAAAGRPVVAADVGRLPAGDDPGPIARALGREARLRGGGLVAGPIDALLERPPEALRAFAELPGLVLLTGHRTWDPAWTPRIPVLVEVGASSAADRAKAWRQALDGELPIGLDAAEVTAHFHLSAEQIDRAATAARQQTWLTGTPLTAEHLRSGARAQNGAGLEGRSRRIAPTVTWDDLVLPPQCLSSLHELSQRVRHRDRVMGEWSMRPGGGRGRGITALFAGDSGTGKTMSAEVIAGELGLDLYTINLATVVDKYVGETEKHLERIFSEADGVNGVLLFDEADAIFGKRSEVRDAHDRYANVEVAYLLQRMESFDGLAILATNLRSNVDDAFTRRLDAIIDFPMPDEAHRGLLWDRCLGRVLPRGPDIDIEFCARQFQLTGGNIRNIAITAAYLAAESNAPVSMVHLVRATQREYRKLGRLCVRSEFGDWLESACT